MSKRKEKKAGKHMKKSELADKLVTFFEMRPSEYFVLKQLFRTLHLTTHPLKMLCVDILNDMVEDGYLQINEKGEFKLNGHGRVMTGIFQRKSTGTNTFIPDDGSEPIHIAERNSMHAMNNDKVRIALCATRKRRTIEGEVIEIIERANDTFVGTLKVEKYYAFLLTESRTLANDIFIPKDKLKGGKNGDKAVVRIVEWPEDAKNPIGQVVDVLGQAGDNTTEMHAILAEFGLPYVYPHAVEAAADKISDVITEADYAEREDFRSITTFTIDPKDAKDFDDALSIRAIKPGLWEVGVHIADVTHYVKEGSCIDKEAEKRATSVYLVDRTIPMLPERLCNLLCSLRPNEEKLAFSAIFEMNDKAEVKKHRIVKTVIKSDRRFTYEEAQAVIETGEGDYKDEILKLNELAQILRKNRMAAGAVDFDRVEVRFDIDEKGRPISVYFKESKEANKLIEEFMLLANRIVAAEIGKMPATKNEKAEPKPFVYRVHDVPDPEKIVKLGNFIRQFGYHLRASSKRSVQNKHINQLLDSCHGTNNQTLIETLTIRSMAKAVYSTSNIGHYGLAFPYYTHFTSPIRRYPDMMVHRLVAKYLLQSKVECRCQKELLEDASVHCSDMEQIAQMAERDSIKEMQARWISNHIGEEFEGIINGVTEFGLFVQLKDTLTEGPVPIRTIEPHDYMQYDEENFCLIAARSGKTYTLSDSVRVRVVKADIEKKQIDFLLVE